MQRTRKPHPRSLDALFGPAPTRKAKPKRKTPTRKRATKKCPAGHPQPQSYKPGQHCSACFQIRYEAQRAETAAADREEWRRLNGPAPATLEIRFKATGRVVRYSIPRHLTPRKVRGRRRRRAV